MAHALVRAARRGVSIYVIMETPDKVKGEDEYSTLKALRPGRRSLFDRLLV